MYIVKYSALVHMVETLRHMNSCRIFHNIHSITYKDKPAQYQMLRQIESIIGHRCKSINPNPHTSFPALYVYPRVGISRSASETNV